MRTLLRVVASGIDGVWVVAPAWSADFAFRMDWGRLPTAIQRQVAPGYRFHAHTDIWDRIEPSLDGVTFTEYEER